MARTPSGPAVDDDDDDRGDVRDYGRVRFVALTYVHTPAHTQMLHGCEGGIWMGRSRLPRRIVGNSQRSLYRFYVFVCVLERLRLCAIKWTTPSLTFWGLDTLLYSVSVKHIHTHTRARARAFFKYNAAMHTSEILRRYTLLWPRADRCLL